jgi:hypothetical protein
MAAADAEAELAAPGDKNVTPLSSARAGKPT